MTKINRAGSVFLNMDLCPVGHGSFPPLAGYFHAGIVRRMNGRQDCRWNVVPHASINQILRPSFLEFV